MMGDISEVISIENVLKALNVHSIETVNPFELEKSVSAVKKAMDYKGVSAVIFKAPCIAVCKPKPYYVVNDKCISCKKCIKEIGCPAISANEKSVFIDNSLCYGCGLCEQICPVNAINGSEVL